MDVSRRNQCQACRFAKCIEANMRREGKLHILNIIRDEKERNNQNLVQFPSNFSSETYKYFF